MWIGVILELISVSYDLPQRRSLETLYCSVMYVPMSEGVSVVSLLTKEENY